MSGKKKNGNQKKKSATTVTVSSEGRGPSRRGSNRTVVSVASPKTRAPKGKGPRPAKAGKRVPKGARNKPMGGNMGASAKGKTIARLMKTLAFPDIEPPMCLGFAESTQTIPHRLFYKFAAPWNVAPTAAPANTLPANEVFLVALNKHPACSLIYSYSSSNGTTLTKTPLNNGSVMNYNLEGWQAFNTCLRSFVTPAGNTYEPCFTDSNMTEGNWVWLDGANAQTYSIVLTLAAGVAFAATNYTLDYCRRFADRVTYGAVTQAAAAGQTITWNPSLQPGYYAFKLPNGTTAGAIFNAAIQISAFTISVSNAAGVAVNWVAHDPLPANMCVTMDAIRINATRATMTNFSGPFNAEGGAAAYEMPVSTNWSRYAEDPASGTFGPSIFTNLLNANGSEEFENSQGISAAGHPDLHKEPVDCSDSEVAIGNTNAATAMTSPSFDDIGGGVILVVRTGVTNTAARDGLWQVFYHTESQNDSQQYTSYPAMVGPVELLEAEGLFKNFRTITHNPDHFRKGISALRNVFAGGERVGDALISTGIGGGLGGTIKGYSGIAKRLFS